jgi:apolipoprotein N-acyltransferase
LSAISVLRIEYNRIKLKPTWDESSKSINGNTGLEKIPALARAGRGLFPRGLHTSTKYPLTGLLIFGYAYGLVRLTNQPGVRRAFYFGLATGFLCYAPQLYFFWNIFGPAAVVLWLVLAFWIGLFAAIVCGSIRRWGKGRAAWLIPIIWTGLEYFRSELYYLKFSWLNAGYALPLASALLGMYGAGLLIFFLAAFFFQWRQIKMSLLRSLSLFAVLGILFGISHGYSGSRRPSPQINLVGIQLEFPPPALSPKFWTKPLPKTPMRPSSS